MQIKLFGKQLFEIKKNSVEYLLGQSSNQARESKFLPDFSTAQSNNTYAELTQYVTFTPSDPMSTSTATGGVTKIVKVEPKKDEKKEKLTPKGVHELKLLHDQTFKLNVDPEYVDSQIADFKDKLALIKSEEYDMARGLMEISSILLRLENRKKYTEVKEFFENYPYTTTSKINAVVKEHDYLKLGQVAQFLADMPKEAVQAMKDYNKFTGKLCGKQAVFYIIADKKDFEKSNKRRDPILLAQSPFGHFWQILGAWDKEMMFLEEL